ncbi:hypothetical protein NBRC116592_04140 [Colwellia sp. KU-HH00111]|uniref:hypothetical protein n=1 Tax=Colwellia sp. KU-HH00111 TaxID=3127652 RepID=UPI003104D3E5
MLPQHLKHTSWDQLQNGTEYYLDEVEKIVLEPGYELKLYNINEVCIARMRCNGVYQLLYMYEEILHKVKNFNEGVIEIDNTVCPYTDWD